MFSLRKNRYLLLVTVCLMAAGIVATVRAQAGTGSPTSQPAASLAQWAAQQPPQRTPVGLTIPAATVIETFSNSWHASTIGMVYDSNAGYVRYAHEGQTANPATIWDVALLPPHGTLNSYNLSALNAGWPVALNDRNGAGFDPTTNTYFMPDFQGDLTVRDDNIVEINAAGTILNAWELDGAGNDSSDASFINGVIDIAVVPGTPNRYFVAAADNNVTVYEISLIRAGIFTPASWSTVSVCTVSSLGDVVGIDYDAQQGLLYLSSFSNEMIAITDLACNVQLQFTCDGGGAYHTGITFIENANPPEIWVTDFNSNSTTRCEVPQIALEKTVSTDGSCGSSNNITVTPGTEVTYCYEVTNLTNLGHLDPITYTTHTLVDDQLGTILSSFPYTLGPGDSTTITTTAVITQSTANVATWTATVGPNSAAASAAATVVAFLPSNVCTTYNSPNVPVIVGPNPGTVTSNLVISDSFPIYDANVGVNILHSWDADLNISLISPAAATFDLSSGNGGSADHYLDTIFDSQALVSIVGSSPPFTGRFRPEESLDPLNGQNSAGTWTLQIQDTATGDGGSLTAWHLELCEEPVATIIMTQTVGTTSSVCATTQAITVTAGTDVYYCYTVTNTGNYTLTHHSLTDSFLGTVLNNATYTLGPGETVTTVDLGVVATSNMTTTTTSNSTWTASIPGFLSGSGNSSASVTVLQPTATPTPTPTNTPTPTPTNTPTNTPTSTPTNIPTNTPTNTPTSTATSTSTETPSPTPTGTSEPPTSVELTTVSGRSGSFWGVFVVLLLVVILGVRFLPGRGRA